MTAIYLTIDTEYSAGLAARLGLHAFAENFARSIACTHGNENVGIVHQMEMMDAHGLKGVFFVDPMPALIWGPKAIATVVEPILKRGHEVQLHIHTEWLALAGEANPLRGRTGGNLKDFSESEQFELIALAKEWLTRAGAPEPTAFRAGNYGANDATLRALARNAIRYDSSHAPGMRHSACAIGLGPADQRVVLHQGALEVPVGTIRSFRGLRHAQITALSHWEMAAAIRFAVRTQTPMLNIVGHSFELMSRDRTRINSVVKNRFERLCRTIADTAGARTATFASRPPRIGDMTGAAHMPHSEIRSAARIAEQMYANTLFGAA